MARVDLTNREIEQMAEEKPGSAAEYLRLRREELEAEKQARREADDFARFERAFVGEGGTKDAAREAYTRYRNEEAEKAVGAADERARRETVERMRATL
ncbi:MAG: hypothetical protein WKF53_09940 [Rubrobacter sp.]